MGRDLNEHTILNNENDVPYITFKSFSGIPWLRCGFSTRLGGVSSGYFSTMNMSFTRGDDEKNVRENIRRFGNAVGFSPEDIVMPHQCHTTNVRVAGMAEKGCGVTSPGCEEEIDGQITAESGVVLYCLGADCVPIFFADTAKKVVAASHAGWKGTLGNIAKMTVDRMASEFGSAPKDIKAVIGPSICMDCYEVGLDVAEPFISEYKSRKEEAVSRIGKDKVTGRPDGQLTDVVRSKPKNPLENPSEKYYLNLWEANRINLINAGLKYENIEVCGYCTKCHPDMLFSHRYHGDRRGVNIGYIFKK